MKYERGNYKVKAIIKIDTTGEKPFVVIKKTHNNIVLSEKTTTPKGLLDALKQSIEGSELDGDILLYSTGILPANCVKQDIFSEDGTRYDIWIEVPKNKWDITFYQTPMSSVGFPRLLFKYSVQNKLIMSTHVFAVCNDAGPISEKTKLYQFPYSNVHPTGRVCTGTISYPSINSSRELETLHALFFGSTFNHDLAGSGNQLVGERFKQHIEKDYNDDLLTPIHKTFGDM
ncbi:hypothetical protein FT638_25230 [Bacillus cereus]|nr:hypothetical protein [Bacillus cereus]